MVEIKDSTTTAAVEPFSRVYTLAEFMNWNPTTDPMLPFRRCPVALASRVKQDPPPPQVFTSSFINGTDGKLPIQGQAAPAADNLYNFQYWHLIDHFAFTWGEVAPPTPQWVSAGHRNGVRVYGSVSPSSNASLFLETKTGANKKPYYPVADQMLLMAKEYAFDGWVLDVEEGSPSQMDEYLDFLSYYKKTMDSNSDYQNQKLIWYGVGSQGGWNNELNANNKPFFELTDMAFINYGWGESNNNMQESAQTAGDRAKEVFMGVAVEVVGWTGDQAAWGSYPYQQLNQWKQLDYPTSIALYSPNWTYAGSTGQLTKPTLAQFEQNEVNFWEGWSTDAAGWPQKPETAADGFSAIASYTDMRSVIGSAPFRTCFNTGVGKRYFIAGEPQIGTWNSGWNAEFGAWNDISQQEVLPTRRIPSGPGKVSFDFDNAYDGGSSLSIQAQGEVKASLFKTDISLESASLVLEFQFMAPTAPAAFSVGFRFGDDSASISYNIVKLDQAGQWTRSYFSLGAATGFSLQEIVIKTDLPQLNIGSVALHSGTLTTPTVGAIQVKNATRSTAYPMPGSCYLSWEAGTGDVAYYNIFQLNGGTDSKTHLFLGRTSRRIFYVGKLLLQSDATNPVVNPVIAVQPVAPDGGAPAIDTYTKTVSFSG